MSQVRNDADNRRLHLPQLMEHVRMPLLSKDYLLHKVDSEPLIRDSVECKDYLIEALKYHLYKSSGETSTSQQEAEESISFVVGSRAKPRKPVNLPQLMLIIGGQAPKAIRNVDAYDFQHDEWHSLSELPNRRCRCD